MKKTQYRNNALMCVALSALFACAVTDPTQEYEAVRDYIAAAELEETDRIRTRPFSGSGFRALNEEFAVMSTREGHYLLEMTRRCPALVDNTMLQPDVRRDSTAIRARFDTIRGCRIGRIYAIDEAQAQELEQLGDAPGDESVEGTVEQDSDPQ